MAYPKNQAECRGAARLADAKVAPQTGHRDSQTDACGSKHASTHGTDHCTGFKSRWPKSAT
jgi:hypothetical protein